MSSYKGYTLEDADKITTIGQAKSIAKKMGIRGYTTWKLKNGDLPTAINLIKAEIQEERKEPENEDMSETERIVDDEKVMIARQIADMTGEDYEYLLTQNIDWLNKLQRDLEDADMRITTSGIPVEKTPKPQKSKSLTANERISKITRETKSLSDSEIDRILGKETGSVDLSLPISRGDKSRAQEILDESGLTQSRANKFEVALLNGNVNEMRNILTEAGVPVNQIEGVIKTGQKLSSGINEKSLNDGSWLTNTAGALGGLEIKVWQMAMKAVGADMSSKQKSELRDMNNGNYKGSVGDGTKLLLRAGINPDSIGVMVSEAAKKRGQRIKNSWSDLVSPSDKIKQAEAGQNISDMKARQIINDRKATIKKKEKEERELHRLSGGKPEDYKGTTYKENKEWEKRLDPVSISEYGNVSDPWYVRLFNAIGTTGKELMKEVVDPAGLIEIVDGEPVKSPQLIDLENKLKDRDPNAYNKYLTEYNRHVSATGKASVKDRNQKMIPSHVPIAKQLGNIIDATLEENARRLSEGKPPILSKEKIKEYVGYSNRLKAGSVSYHDLARIRNRYNSDIDTSNLSEKIIEKNVRWDLDEEHVLEAQGSGDSDLNISGDKQAQEELRKMNQIKADKEELKKRIKEQKIDDENREVIESRVDLISTGYVDTDNKGRAELRPRITWGDTDGKLNPTTEEVENANEINNTMMMWDTLRTDDNSTDNSLLKIQLQAERNRYRKTFAIPKDNGKKKVEKISYNQKMGYRVDYCDYDNVPVAFLKHSDTKLIPVYAPISESEPLLTKPEQVQGPFSRQGPSLPQSIDNKVNKLQRPNVFPERILQGYRGSVLNFPNKRFNPWINQNYIR